MSERSKSADFNDQASEIEDDFRATAIQQIQKRNKQQQQPRSDGSFEITECEDCGDNIGLERLKVAAQNLLCVLCASTRERWKGYRR